MRELHWHRCRTEKPGYATGNPPTEYMARHMEAANGADPCEPSRMGAKSTTPSNHRSTPGVMVVS